MHWKQRVFESAAHWLNAFQVLSRQKTAPQNFFLRSRDVEQGTGVEPAFTAWEAVVLPIYEPCTVRVL